MSQHILKYHYKSLICTNTNKISEVNGNNGYDIETDAENNNGGEIIIGPNTAMKFIRITENPLQDN